MRGRGATWHLELVETTFDIISAKLAQNYDTNSLRYAGTFILDKDRTFYEGLCHAWFLLSLNQLKRTVTQFYRQVAYHLSLRKDPTPVTLT